MFCDDKGDLISAIRFGRSPEHKKASLKETLAKDLAHMLSQRPDLRLCKVADAGNDSWEFLETLPQRPLILDFFHATEKLGEAVAAAYGDGTMETRHTFERLRERLLTEDEAATAVIDAVARLKRKFPRRDKIAKVLAYLRKNRPRSVRSEPRFRGGRDASVRAGLSLPARADRRRRRGARRRAGVRGMGLGAGDPCARAVSDDSWCPASRRARAPRGIGRGWSGPGSFLRSQVDASEAAAHGTIQSRNVIGAAPAPGA